MGFTLDRFVTPKFDPILLCRLCHLVLREARQCPQCKTTFCFSCIRHLLKTSDTCPDCPNHLNLSSLADPPKELITRLGKLLIRCQHHFEGCPATVALSTLPNHLNTCEYRPQNLLACTRCNFKIPKTETRHNCLFTLTRIQTLLHQETIDIKDNIEELKSKVTDDHRAIVTKFQEIEDEITRLSVRTDNIPIRIMRLQEEMSQIKTINVHSDSKPTAIDKQTVTRLSQGRSDSKRQESVSRLEHQVDGLLNNLTKLESDYKTHHHTNEDEIGRLRDELNKLETTSITNLEAKKEMAPLVKEIKKFCPMSAQVENAFCSVDRGNFSITNAYEDKPVITTQGRYLYPVSWCVKMVNLLAPVLQEGNRVLVMGAAPGYEVAIFACLVGRSGRVIAQEGNLYLKDLTRHLWEDKPKMIKRGQISIVHQDGVNNPYKPKGPYDAIFNRYKQDGTFKLSVYLDVLNTGGRMVHGRASGIGADAFLKTEDGKAQALHCELE